jgi:enoyl-CoA hydratase/carnithine racemase
MSATGPVRLEHEGEMAVVTFDSPPLNLFDEELGQALAVTLDELERTEPRAVMFRAEGRVVSAGVDVQLFAAQPDVESANEVFEWMLDLVRRADALPCPTVFAAHALCLTWAFELALGCDIILAAESSAFGLVERVVGLTPTMGGTQRLAERAGSGRAREFVMTGDRYSAATMERWNVVNRVLADDGFDAAARAFTAELAAGPTRAHAATKQVIRDWREGGVELANDRICALAASLFDTEDLRGAVASFLADGPGKATFLGR